MRVPYPYKLLYGFGFGVSIVNTLPYICFKPKKESYEKTNSNI